MSISQKLVMDNVLQSLPHPMQEGYLYITGRMKEIIITASGEKVPPRPIEEAIKRELPLISNAIVIGDQQRFLCCLVTLKVRYIRTRRFQDRFSGQTLCRQRWMKRQVYRRTGCRRWHCRVARQREAPPTRWGRWWEGRGIVRSSR